MSHREIHQIRDARDMFLLDCEARPLTPATRDFYRRKLRPFIRWLEEHDTRELQELTAHHFRQFLVSVNQRDLSAQYQNNLARAFHAVLNAIVEENLQEADAHFGTVDGMNLE